MDYLDFLVDTSDEFLTGYYYNRRPKNARDGRIAFKYKQVDPNSKAFDKIMGNVRADAANYAIKTNDKCGFAVGGYIVTQNGLCWEIASVMTNEEPTKDKDALRFFRVSRRAETTIRMIAVDDLYDIQNAYITKCDISVALNIHAGFESEREVQIESASVTAFIHGATETIETKLVGGKLFFAVEKGASVTVNYAYEIDGILTTGSTYFSQIETLKNEIYYSKDVTETGVE